MTKTRNATPTELLDSTPPSNPDAEKHIIASVLLDASTIDTVKDIVTPEMFHDHRNGRLFGHMLALANGDGGAVDVTLLRNRLRETAETEKCGGAAYLAELFEWHPTVTHATQYAHIVRDNAIRRDLIHTSTEILRDAYSGQTAPTELVRRALTELGQTADTDGGDTPFNVVNCPALASADYSVRYLVRDVLVEGVPCLIGGQLKTLKTTLAISLGVSLATGKPFLGTFPVLESARVLYFIGEGGLGVARDYARRVAASFGIDLADIGGLAFCDQVPQIGSLLELDAMQAAITEHEATVAIYDPLYMMMADGNNAGNIMSQGPIFRNFNRACGKVGVTPCIVHHLKKNRATAGPCEPPELAELSWSGPAEFAGQWLLLGRESAYDPDEPGHHRLWLSCGGRAGHSSLKVLDIDEGRLSDPGGRQWQVSVLSPSEARMGAKDRQEAAKEKQHLEKLEANRRKVVNAMAKYPGGETRTVLRATSGLHTTPFNVALGELLDTQDAKPCDVFKSNKKTPLEAYKLAETGEEI